MADVDSEKAFDMMADNATENQTAEPVDNVNYMAYVYITIGVLSILNNALVLFVLLMNKNMLRSSMNILILNQSVIDGLAGVALVLYGAGSIVPTYEIPDDSHQVLYCYLWKSNIFAWILFTNSTYNIVAITVDRYLAICKGFWYRTAYSHKRLCVVMTLVWFTGPVYYGTSVIFIVNIAENVCQVVHHLGTMQRQIWGVFTFLIIFLLPLIVIVFTYILIVLFLREHKRSSKLPDGSRRQCNSAYKNVLRTLLSVIIVLVVCWTPDQVYFLVTHFNSDIGISSSWIYHVVVNLMFANSFMNPIVYVLRYKSFRKTMLRTFAGGFQHCSRGLGISSGSSSSSSSNESNLSYL